MAANIVYDSLNYYMTYDSDVIVEGFDGYRILEDNGKLFVIYKEIDDRGEVQKKFVLPGNNLDTFIMLEKKYRDFFIKQKILNKMVEKVAQIQGERDEFLKEACDEIYSKPENYIKFVAMNMTKNQFFHFVKERISSYKN